MGNRLPSGTKKNTIVPSTISDITHNQLKDRQELQHQQHTISEKSDQNERIANLLLISSNINTATTLLDSSTSSKRGIPSSHSSKNSSRRSTSSKSRPNLSNRTPALSFKQHYPTSASVVSIESSEDIYHQPYLTARSQRASLMMENLDLGNFPTTTRHNSSKIDLTSPIHSTVNTARRDIITGIITIPASSLSPENIHMAQENMICGLFDEPTSATCSPRNSNSVVNSTSASRRNSQGKTNSTKETPQRPTALPAYLYAINDNSEHDVDGVLKNVDDEGDYFVGGDLINPIFT